MSLQEMSEDPVRCLLQGREDLRLDARLLQLQSLAASFLRHDPITAERKLAIRQFAVTPINHAVGLIEWIDNTRPIFAVYSKWQKLQAARAAGDLCLLLQP